jgi:hypothetical protein
MKKTKTGLTLLLIAMLASPAMTSQKALAQWVQIPLGVPRAPGCDPGYSWQKIGVRYQCVTPQPSCTYGFASAPVWNAGSWSYACNAPPPPPQTTQPTQPPQTPGSDDPGRKALANCAAYAAQNKVTIGPLTRTYQRSMSSGTYTQRYYDTSTGPTWTKSDGFTQSNVYEVYCATMDATGDWAPLGGAGPHAIFQVDDSCQGGCGGAT